MNSENTIISAAQESGNTSSGDDGDFSACFEDVEHEHQYNRCTSLYNRLPFSAPFLTDVGREMVQQRG